MTKDEMIMELMELLKANGRPKQAADVFESAALRPRWFQRKGKEAQDGR